MKKFLLFNLLSLLAVFTACKHDVESVEVRPESVIMAMGDTYQLSAKVKPDKASQHVEWSSNDVTVASVNELGLITAKAAGKCEITVHAEGAKAVCKVTVKSAGGDTSSPVGVDSIRVEPDSVGIMEGNTLQLAVVVYPEDAPQGVSWNTSDATVASVNNKGLVTAMKKGKCVITAEAGGKRSACKVTVSTATEDPAEVKSVKVEPDTVNVVEGKTFQLAAVVSPANAPQEVTWSTSNPAVAKVSTDGMIIAMKKGTCTVSAMAGGKKGSCFVTVKEARIEISGVKVNPDSLKLAEGKTAQLSADVLPAGAPQSVIWSSSNPNVASVNMSGLVTALKAGSCDITATAGTHKGICKVTVSSSTPSVQDSILKFTVNGVAFEMVRVEGGTFTMGATSEQGNDAAGNELPTHKVTLSTYYIGRFEVTQALWKAVMGKNPSAFKGDDKPVESVSWNNCQSFISALNQLISAQLNGKQFALPTEAQWEYAARGGNRSKGYKYAGSNTLNDVGWNPANSSSTHSVGSKTPNELGLYDMSGNVYEWCQDWRAAYSNSDQTNPVGPGMGDTKVSRGGGWYWSTAGCRVSSRGGNEVSRTSDDLGLRLSLQ